MVLRVHYIRRFTLSICIYFLKFGIWHLKVACFKTFFLGLKFIYTGENERPVRALNSRRKEFDGLELINPMVKSKALQIKRMNKEYTGRGGSLDDEDAIKPLYKYQISNNK